MKKYLLQKIADVPNHLFIFWTTLFFFLSILIINPSNKIILVYFVILFFIYYFKIKKFEISLFFTYVSSLIVLTGKTYLIQLVPPGIFSLEIFPFGYSTELVITASHLLAFVMLIHIIRQYN